MDKQNKNIQKIEQVKLSEVKEAKYNPRTISTEELEKLKKSLKKFGCVRPLIINRSTSTLVSGHQTLSAARSLGWKELPAIYVELNLTEEKILNVALNKLSGEFDFSRLKDLLDDIKTEDIFEISGFSIQDLDMMGTTELSSDGSRIVEGYKNIDDLAVRTDEFDIKFKFKDFNDFQEVKKFFMSAKEGWKDKKMLNCNLLKKLVDTYQINEDEKTDTKLKKEKVEDEE